MLERHDRTRSKLHSRMAHIFQWCWKEELLKRDLVKVSCTCNMLETTLARRKRKIPYAKSSSIGRPRRKTLRAEAIVWKSFFKDEEESLAAMHCLPWRVWSNALLALHLQTWRRTAVWLEVCRAWCTCSFPFCSSEEDTIVYTDLSFLATFGCQQNIAVGCRGHWCRTKSFSCTPYKSCY